MIAWFVHIQRCADGGFCTGITADVARRVEGAGAFAGFIVHQFPPGSLS